MIDKFEGEYFFLNNFYDTAIIYDGITYLNAEAAFQAQKTVNISERMAFSRFSAEEAKKNGRKVTLRNDWEDVKFHFMYEICKAKFSQNQDLKSLLLATKNEELVYCSTSGDTIWGMVSGKGKNKLGEILMNIREELKNKSEFDAGQVTKDIIEWIKKYFIENASAYTKAIVGISGGKDSSVVAALCKEALGADRVVGVLMPQGEQHDIDYSRKLVGFLGIQSYEINIGDAVQALMKNISAQLELNAQAKINTPARIRMTTLYAVAACVGGRVANTCNLSEDYVGYATKFGDGAGDFSPLSDLTVTEVIAIGDELGLPYELTHKTPIDGLCGKTDEENLGFTYAELDRYIMGETDLEDKPELKAKIEKMHAGNLHKLRLMPKYVMRNKN